MLAAFEAKEKAVPVAFSQGGEGVGRFGGRVGSGVGGDKFVEPLFFQHPGVAEPPPAESHRVDGDRVGVREIVAVGLEQMPEDGVGGAGCGFLAREESVTGIVAGGAGFTGGGFGAVGEAAVGAGGGDASW
jgi:hypothetical protein